MLLEHGFCRENSFKRALCLHGVRKHGARQWAFWGYVILHRGIQYKKRCL